MGAKIKIEIDAGCSIDRACEDAQHVADLLHICVEFGFNGVACFASPGGHPKVLAEAWEREIGRELITPLDRRSAHSIDRRRQIKMASARADGVGVSVSMEGE